ncbi:MULTISPECIES: YfhO family protein [unclassified Haematospirillum]|uniref:YfhO family protein n=1 Tax=unclassified Haematospirillum TaxID=2622088 RepID=UPI0014399F41|nr:MULTISPECIES: YfhO family protein [unclassified Haematospirillum]NKD54563.1 YfhO family protein [Haematospirillum sp. H4890]NKD74825.1 YfhO family protein [Haematospirillum sp. H4485]NKD88035.1 YfhO family protein [Haematospirillum sp. 15-248]
MNDLIAPVSFAFGLAVTVSCIIRMTGGPGHGQALAASGIPAGFLASWAWMSGFSFSTEGLLEQTAHVALGGALAGIVLDSTDARRWLRVPFILLFAAVCIWAAFGFPTRLPAGPVTRMELMVGCILLTMVWVTTLLGLDLHHKPERSTQGLSILLVLAIGIGLIASVIKAEPVTGPAFALAAATAGVLVLASPLGTGLSSSAILGGGGALLGLAQGLGARWPGSILPLLITGLGLFAGPTARRMPGPVWAKPLWAALLASIPVMAGCILALANRNP